MKSKKARCVCSVVHEIAVFYGSNLAGEIYFKHYEKCRFKTQGSYEWTGAGFDKLGR